MPAAFATASEIQSLILHILGLAEEAVFADTIDAGQSQNKAYTDEAITIARRQSAIRLIEAIGSNPSHPYWGELSDFVTVAYDEKIPACYGNIGTPEVQPTSADSFSEAEPSSSAKIQSIIEDSNGCFTDFLGEGSFSHSTRRNGALSPFTRLFDTGNGRIKFTGYACRIPMIRVPETHGAIETLADTKVPYHLMHTVARSTIGLVVPKGEAMYNFSLAASAEGQADIEAIKSGATRVAPIDVGRLIQYSKRYNQ
jgi:hypothetical protein